LFVALGATETVLVPDALLGFDLFHLKDGLLAGSAIGSVNLGALNKKNRFETQETTSTHGLH
jgi:hypothetical protein